MQCPILQSGFNPAMWCRFKVLTLGFWTLNPGILLQSCHFGLNLKLNHREL